MHGKQRMFTLIGTPYKEYEPIGWKDTPEKRLLENYLKDGWHVAQLCPIGMPMPAENEKQAQQSCYGVLVIIEENKAK